MMVKRNRPRLNVTLDREVKERMKKIAADLGLSLSRLLEFILEDFLEEYEQQDSLPADLEEKIKSFRKEKTGQTEEKQIENILQDFDS
ncbi:MAG: DUF6364 family protein [bacterium]